MSDTGPEYQRVANEPSSVFQKLFYTGIVLNTALMGESLAVLKYALPHDQYLGLVGMAVAGISYFGTMVAGEMAARRKRYVIRTAKIVTTDQARAMQDSKVPGAGIKYNPNTGEAVVTRPSRGGPPKAR